MPRPRSAELAIRDEQIAIEAGEGVPRRALAKKYGISEARLSQIILAKQDEISDDALRAELVTKVEFVLEKIMEIFSRPRQVKVSPSGRPVYEPDPDDPTGKTQDFSRPIYDDGPIIEAAKMVPNLVERVSKFRALDRPKPKEKDESQEFTEMMQWVQGVVAENKALKARMDAMGLDVSEQVFEADVIPTAEDLEILPPATDS